ncbi:hypothetical protein [Microbacterium sp. No. 7]|uniref:hypothetical protein n=1 Tax=Microbacterium sp. No. 7 TaxID=1714373 RepID=UPI0006D0692A|nr:hypothetical protein [Microbacterium sp. No. 7]ALJ21514.1 hypothetical protein AOA12_17095 [Microbacterium sp. No. 7]
MRMRRWPLSALLPALLAVTACGAGTPAAETGTYASSLEAMIEQELERNELSDWDRAVLEKALETGQISRADYLEGADMYEQCMAAASVAMKRTDHPNGLIEHQPATVSADDAERDAKISADHECMRAGWGRTQELYSFQTANPDLLRDSSEVVVRCLFDAGIIDEDFTRDDFQAYVRDDYTPEKLPFDIMDATVQSCLWGAGIVFRDYR